MDRSRGQLGAIDGRGVGAPRSYTALLARSGKVTTAALDQRLTVAPCGGAARPDDVSLLVLGAVTT